jgi:16S rRNA (uracil1498-N3)-methyltransferase
VDWRGAALHRFFVPDAGDEGWVHFSAAQAHQMASVLRLRAGAEVRAFDGVLDRDRVVRIDRLDQKVATGEVVGEAAQAAEPSVAIDVFPALLRRERFEQALQKLTEVGAASISPVLTARCVVRESGDERRTERWQAILREAAEQSGRGRVPRLGHARPFAEALTAAAHLDRRMLIAYEGERTTTLRQALGRGRQGSEGVALFIGPEGGFESAEVERARALGAISVRLGPRILRAETASPVFTALVLHELEAE